MQTEIQELIQRNRKWAMRIEADQPDFFPRLARQQRPEILWIGCSDSRVPATQIVDLEPGSIFVHRNIANVVVHSDMNCLSVIQFAVEVLRVKHVIVCGHYGCGGVKAAMQGHENGLIDNWLGHIRDVHQTHRDRISACAEFSRQHDLLCRLNVEEQVRNVCETTIVRNAWKNGQALAVHGWIYRLENGHIEDLSVSRFGPEKPDQ